MDFEKFKEQIEQADNDSLITSLIEHSKKADTDINYYEAVKLIKKELLNRLEDTAIIDVSECLQKVEELESDGIQYAELKISDDKISIHSVADDFNSKVDYDYISLIKK